MGPPIGGGPPMGGGPPGGPECMGWRGIMWGGTPAGGAPVLGAIWPIMGD